MNYHDVMELRHLGHEMAVSSIRKVTEAGEMFVTELHFSDDKNLYLKNYTAWTEELAGMRRIMMLQAEIPEEDVLGARAPGLKPGYNTQYEVMVVMMMMMMLMKPLKEACRGGSRSTTILTQKYRVHSEGYVAMMNI